MQRGIANVSNLQIRPGAIHLNPHIPPNVKMSNHGKLKSRTSYERDDQIPLANNDQHKQSPQDYNDYTGYSKTDYAQWSGKDEQNQHYPIQNDLDFNQQFTNQHIPMANRKRLSDTIRYNQDRLSANSSSNNTSVDNEKIFNCSHCEYVTTHYHNFKRHVGNKHQGNERKYIQGNGYKEAPKTAGAKYSRNSRNSRGPDFSNFRIFFFIARAPDRFGTNPRSYTD